jgi:hypothetical protein
MWNGRAVMIGQSLKIPNSEGVLVLPRKRNDVESIE